MAKGSLESFYYEVDGDFKDLSSQIRLYMIREQKDGHFKNVSAIVNDFDKFKEDLDCLYFCEQTNSYCNCKLNYVDRISE